MKTSKHKIFKLKVLHVISTLLAHSHDPQTKVESMSPCYNEYNNKTVDLFSFLAEVSS